MSCLISRQHFERVDGFVRRALAAGARAILGGSPNDELGHLFYRPTILVDAEPGSEILTEEVFGPVLTIQTFLDRGAGRRHGQQHPVRTCRDLGHRRS